MTKKTLKLIRTLFIFTLPICCVYGDEENPYKFPYDNKYVTEPSTIDLPVKVDIDEDNSIMKQLLEIFGFDGLAFDGDHKFIIYVRAILNIALGVISFIAFIMVIYTFYKMFLPGDEKGFEKAKGNLVGIFIALAIVGLAWLIVSFIFRWYKSNWLEKQNDIGEGNITMINIESNNQIYLTA